MSTFQSDRISPYNIRALILLKKKGMVYNCVGPIDEATTRSF